MTPPPKVFVTVDLVVLTVREGRFCVLLVRRAVEPFAGRWALPGGFVLDGEDLADAAGRELAEETGLADLPVHLEQLATYGAPDRDPRGRVVTVAHLAVGPGLPDPVAGSDAEQAWWHDVEDALGAGVDLCFDHARILADGVERARAKLEYTPLAAAFCPAPFTVAELRAVYEAVWGVPLDPRNFHRKVTGAAGFLTPADGTTTRNGGRPARLYSAGPAPVLQPALLRAGD
jgi:8-oxo-dGTP diphosphatase